MKQYEIGLIKSQIPEFSKRMKPFIVIDYSNQFPETYMKSTVQARVNMVFPPYEICGYQSTI